jgi:hypothetical protein
MIHLVGGLRMRWVAQPATGVSIADKLTLFAVENGPFIDDLPLNIVIFYS